jgi:HTH-type transcriptional regulator / antitoxin HigA
MLNTISGAKRKNHLLPRWQAPQWKRVLVKMHKHKRQSMKNLSIIKNRETYEKYHQELVKLMLKDPDPESPEADDIEHICLLIEHWEKQQQAKLPSDNWDAIDVITHLLESSGKTRKDLEPLIGDAAMVSRVMNRKRQLSKVMIQNLHEKMGVPLPLLMAKRDEALKHAH